MNAASTEVQHFYVLCNGILVSQVFYEHIKQHVTERLPELTSGLVMELKKICGHGFWQNLSDGDRRTAGLCMANMVKKKELPLTHVVQKHEYPKKYRLD